ncbi:hypothetical protein LEL_10591 [Akanthomyces lecanii RCEF 1005]|uniref:Uncharacterized protein n=1 Tax=Akanthomyces lecanii RCEF 1005 TaxID=1081108 RepID=A0A167XLZ8_CORDF|nr:hypothetical protein LEL_10591 [Akanthomyces lecanii RCEF 1005]
MLSTSAGNDSSVSKSDRITASTLLLRHDGVFYSHPECLKDVPVEKVHRGHPYWEKCWPDLHTDQTQQFWKDRYNTVRGSNDKVKRYLYNRQVNRGTAILAFLADGKVSPFQLLSKKYMKIVGKGSISSYDTLYQLCHTVEELLRFKLDIEPIDWLRQRLHELIEEQGLRFNLSRTIRDFYRDPKLTVLRAESGFMRIGRPPGQSRGNEKARRALKREASHVDTTSVIVSRAISQSPTAANETNKRNDERQNGVNILQSRGTRNLLPVKSWNTDWKELSEKNLSEHSNSASLNPRDVAGFDWQLVSITRMMAGEKQIQDLQLCRLRDMEMVNQTRLLSSWYSKKRT